MERVLQLPEGKAWYDHTNVVFVALLAVALPATVFGLFCSKAAEVASETGESAMEVLLSAPPWMLAAIVGATCAVEIPMLIMLWVLARLAVRWRGTEIWMSQLGLSVKRGDHRWQVPWGDVTEVRPEGRGLRIATDTAGELAIPSLALSKGKFRGCTGKWRHVQWASLGLLAQAYAEGVRRTERDPLGEPPVVEMRGPSAVLGRCLLAMGIPFNMLASMSVLSASRIRSGPALGFAFVSLGAYLAVCLVALWINAKLGEESLCIGPEGIRIDGGKGPRRFPWDEVQEVRRSCGLGVRVRADGRWVELPMIAVGRANLAVLARADGLRPDQLALAACAHYATGGVGDALEVAHGP